MSTIGSVAVTGGCLYRWVDVHHEVSDKRLSLQVSRCPQWGQWPWPEAASTGEKMSTMWSVVVTGGCLYRGVDVHHGVSGCDRRLPLLVSWCQRPLIVKVCICWKYFSVFFSFLCWPGAAFKFWLWLQFYSKKADSATLLVKLYNHFVTV